MTDETEHAEPTIDITSIILSVFIPIVGFLLGIYYCFTGRQQRGWSMMAIATAVSIIAFIIRLHS